MCSEAIHYFALGTNLLEDTLASGFLKVCPRLMSSSAQVAQSQYLFIARQIRRGFRVTLSMIQ
jgi:hypothetical protein